MRAKTRPGLTLIELLMALLIIGILISLVTVAVRRARASARVAKDGVNIRSVHQALVTASLNNRDSYPVPSQLDQANTTLPAGLKDLPRDLLSYLIYNGFTSPDVLVSAAEVNPLIRVWENFAYQEPELAASQDRTMALWDPAFRAYPGDLGRGPQAVGFPGGCSYAFMPLAGQRLAERWRRDFDAGTAILSNRGPAYSASGSGATLSWRLFMNTSAPPPEGTTAQVGIRSRSLAIHGNPETWEGNVAYNDGRVVFERDPDPAHLIFTFVGLPSAGRNQRDNIFVNENDSSRSPDNDAIAGLGLLFRTNYLRPYCEGTQNEIAGETGPLTSIRPWYD